jgi:hypothetical protein
VAPFCNCSLRLAKIAAAATGGTFEVTMRSDAMRHRRPQLIGTGHFRP